MFTGIDLSLTGTGIVLLDKDGTIIKQELYKTNAKQDIEERLINITDYVLKICQENESMIYIEGPSYASQGQAILQMGALHFMTRCKLYSNGMTFNIIPPSQIKKFVTGKGNAKKELMLAYVVKKFDILFEDNNLCDAFCLARMALEENK